MIITWVRCSTNSQYFLRLRNAIFTQISSSGISKSLNIDMSLWNNLVRRSIELVYCCGDIVPYLKLGSAVRIQFFLRDKSFSPILGIPIISNDFKCLA